MFVTTTFGSRKPVDRLVIPASAEVHLLDEDWVVVPAGGKQFRRVAVQPGPELKDGYLPVISGLKADEHVVIGGLQFANAQRSSKP